MAVSKIVRHRTYQIGGEDGELVRLKKWSAGKLFFLVREFWGVVEKALADLDLDKLTEFQLIASIIEILLQQEKRAAAVIRWSIDDPSGLTEDEILEWDADEFIGVLTEVIEMNVTEELVKNFQKLLSTASKKFSKPKKRSKTKEPEASTVGSVA